MKRLLQIFLSIWLSIFFAFGVAAVERHALVVGNGAYEVGPLSNPVNDAADLAVALRGLGFAVRHLENVSRIRLRREIREFSNDLSDGSVGLFYFSGHGIQANGKNYLIPIGADIQQEFEIEDEAVGVRTVLGAMENSNSGMNIVILDACRSNPFRSFFKSANRGLSIVHAPKGSLIAFSTAPGQWAADGVGRNSPYTKHLLRAITIPNLAIEQVFKKVRIAVNQETGGAQVPWEESSLMADFYFYEEPQPDVETTVEGESTPVVEAPIEQKDEQEEKPGEEETEATNQCMSALRVKATEIQQKVYQNWAYGGPTSGLRTTLSVKVDRGGSVTSMRILKTSGDHLFDRSAENAVRKASPLPIPNDSRCYEFIREFNFTFNPGG